MDTSPWALVLLTIKLPIYAGTLAAVGGGFLYFLAPGSPASSPVGVSLRPYILGGALLGLVAVLLQIPIQAGAFAGTGISGIWDGFMLQLMWQSPVGDAVLLRALGFSLIVITCLVSVSPHSVLVKIIWSLAVLILAAGFAASGHTRDLGLVAQIALSVHVLIMAWWLGSLWPLWRACFLSNTDDLRSLMHRFGQWAVLPVLLLLASGLFLTWQLLGSLSALFNTEYGVALAIKLSVVLAILIVASLNKIRWVPMLLRDQTARKKLAASIRWESVLAVSILVVTAIFTTLVGPAH